MFAMFPAASVGAIAERLWEGGDAAPYADFGRRLPTHLRRLAAAGCGIVPLTGRSPDSAARGKPLTIEAREQIVAGLVERLIERSKTVVADDPK